ncbi:MAG TPA: FkbM family methyltransferase [Magnetospirillaceae bacterium]|jgi:FkbM family methyltransferase
MIEFKKAARTVQNRFPVLASLKNRYYDYSRRYLRIAHERDFAIIALLPRSENDLFLDIGSNRGQSILSIRAYRSDARIISFEPNPAIYRQTARHFAGDPLLTIENFGLGQREGSFTLYIPTYRGLVYDGNATCVRDVASQYLSPDRLYFFDQTRVKIEEHPCTLKTLDSLDLSPSFIKIDVEGFEYDVLAGGQTVLQKHQPVLMFEREYCGSNVFDIVARLGYEPVVVENGRIARGDHGGLNVIMMTAERFKVCSTAI